MKSYVYSDFSTADSLTLEIGGVAYAVAQFTASFAANEIPTAAVMVAVGRDARTQNPAAIHLAGQHRQMTEARVYFEPREQADQDNDWPQGRRLIFDGFFTGFAYRKINGKIHVVVNLMHWIAALGFSSCLTGVGHVGNPTALNAAAVFRHPDGAVAGDPQAAQVAGTSELFAAQLIGANLAADLWKGIKSMFCKLARIPAAPMAADGLCSGTADMTINTAALDALDRIEGPADECTREYTYGVPLKLDTRDLSLVEDSIAEGIGHMTMESYSTTSFWDKLVGEFCPAFGMAVVPMVESAVVVADVPAYNAGVWKEIRANDYDGLDLTRELHRPLRAVGVVAGYDSQLQAGMNEGSNVPAPPPSSEQYIAIGGCYAEDSVKPGDGMVLYVASPPWLRSLHFLSVYAGESTGMRPGEPGKTATTPVDPPKPVEDTGGTFGTKVGRLYSDYAHDVFVNNMLRGQGGSISGKLRFDIAPLSIVRVNPTSERFIGAGQDDLAVTVFGCVQRVTIAINAEASMAGTTLTLSHVRTGSENTQPRTSVSKHPLFGTSIHGGGKHGCPLVADYDFNRTEALAGDGPEQANPGVT